MLAGCDLYLKTQNFEFMHYHLEVVVLNANFAITKIHLNMKKFYLLPLTAVFALAGAVSCDKTPGGSQEQPDPVFEISENAIQATADGGQYEIPYVLVNPAEDGVLELTSDVDWVSDPDYSSKEGAIVVTVAPNYESADRNANLRVTYTYGEEGTVLEDQIVLHQVYQYDVNTETGNFSGGYFYGREESQANYAIYLTDLGTDEGGTFMPGCTVYRLDFRADGEPEDWTNITIPEGTYSFDALDELTSFYGKVNADASAWETTAYITDCTINVTRDGENTVIDGVLTIDDKIHHVYYEGPAKVDLYSAEGIGLSVRDLELVGTHLASNPSYVDDNGEVMIISMSFAGTPENDDFANPYVQLYIELYAPYDSREILPGTYTVGSSQGAYTMYPGYIDPATLYCFGTYAYDCENYSVNVALAQEGTIEVSKDENDIYTLDVNLKTVFGNTITGTYVGELVVPNIPGQSFSTLTDDYTVKMDEIDYCFGSYWGDEFGTGGGHFDWSMEGPFEQNPDQVLTDGTGEYVEFDIVCSSLDYHAGISSGTYTVAENPEAPKPGEFIPGTRSTTGMNTLEGTFYTGAYEGGYVSVAAPAVGGELEVTNHGDGTYTLKFAFEDGMGHIWDGEWTGELSFMDWTWLLGAPEKSRPNYVERRMAPDVETEESSVDNAAELRSMIKTLPSL